MGTMCHVCPRFGDFGEQHSQRHEMQNVCLVSIQQSTLGKGYWNRWSENTGIAKKGGGVLTIRARKNLQNSEFSEGRLFDKIEWGPPLKTEKLL